MYQRSASSDINPANQTKANKPILRNVNSDAGLISPKSKRPMSLIEQYEVSAQNLPEPLSPLVIEHTNLDSTGQIFHEFTVVRIPDLKYLLECSPGLEFLISECAVAVRNLNFVDFTFLFKFHEYFFKF